MKPLWIIFTKHGMFFVNDDEREAAGAKAGKRGRMIGLNAQILCDFAEAVMEEEDLRTITFRRPASYPRISGLM